jgi:lipoprotein-anchoring transpeptidase ErfK/SrfK
MKTRHLSVFSLVALFALGGGPVFALTAEEVNQATIEDKAHKESRKDTRGPDPLIVKAQALLSRRSISPGVIDGFDGENYRKAIAQFRRQERLGDGDEMDEPTWLALGGGTTDDIVAEYILSEKDASTDFPDEIPRDYAKQAAMKRLSYTSAEEMFAERFHMGEKLLKALNPRADYSTAGEPIRVVSLKRQRPEGLVERVEAVKLTGMVVVFGPGETILASYPATIGSNQTPSPEGEYTVERIVRNPAYHYDPEKNFQQGNNTERLVLPAGPNNPVGTVWIALSKPTFGIHGTPEPSLVSKTSSHGCIRLTNWDAEELADMVKPGVPVRFVE